MKDWDKAVAVSRRPAPGRRLIAVSDVHGNLPGLQALLQKANYSERDILVLVGDLIEKGPQNLALLRYVMQLSQQREVWALAGNNDDVLVDLVLMARHGPAYPLPGWLPGYLAWRGNTILEEMRTEAGLASFAPGGDAYAYARLLVAAFPAEFAFLAGLPHIVETPDALFVHAGLDDVPPEQQSREHCLCTPAFMEQGLRFGKWCIVGHWPVSGYGDDCSRFSPRIDAQARIVGIDGGNMVRPDGQLNALLLWAGAPGRFATLTHDSFPPVRVLAAQADNGGEAFHIRYTNRHVQALEEKGDATLCRHLESSRTLWVPTERLWNDRDGRLCATDCSNYHLPLAPGDKATLLMECSLGALLRKDSVAGWYGGAYERI